MGHGRLFPRLGASEPEQVLRPRLVEVVRPWICHGEGRPTRGLVSLLLEALGGRGDGSLGW